MILSFQGFEILTSFKDTEVFCSIAPYLLNRVMDRHNRFYLLSHFNSIQPEIMTKVYKKMGKAYSFSFWNPTGHYLLNLGNPVERDIAVSLIVISKEACKKITAGERLDKSQRGNKHCFRNEKLNSQSFIINNEWELPESGTLEFDFVHILDWPNP